MTPNVYLEARLKKLKNSIKVSGLEALYVDDAINLFYLTGLQLSTGKLIVTLDDAILFVDGRYLEYCQSRSSVPVQLIQPNLEAMKIWIETKKIKQIAFNTDVTSYKDFLELQRINAATSFIPIDNLVKKLRSIKDSHEITLMREAADLGSEGFRYAASLLKENVSEEEIANELEIFWKRKGCKGVSFDPIIAFGKNSSMPHHRSSSAKLKMGDTVLIDIGVQNKHYASDMTRVVFFGNPHPEMQKVYDIVKAAQQAALEKCRPGVTMGELDRAARNLIASKGYDKYFTHGLGHGVGLEIHEPPSVRNDQTNGHVVAEPGMVLTIEPGIYLPGIGGVRLEDAVLITQDNYENLTKLPL